MSPSRMTLEQRRQRVADLQMAWDLFFQQCRLLATMPIEEWVEALEFADTVGPVLDPTTYRDWIYSGKREIMLPVMRAGLQVKRAVLAAQPQLKAMLEQEAEDQNSHG